MKEYSFFLFLGVRMSVIRTLSSDLLHALSFIHKALLADWAQSSRYKQHGSNEVAENAQASAHIHVLGGQLA